MFCYREEMEAMDNIHKVKTDKQITRNSPVEREFA